MKKSLIFLMLLSACAGGGHIAKRGNTPAQDAADTASCKYEMHKAIAGMSSDDPIGAGLRGADLFNECMAMKGYVDVK